MNPNAGSVYVYEFTSYKDFLRAKIEENSDVYGYQTQLAKVAGCQRSFLSQALHSHVHLTPEQACGLANHFRFNDDQRGYFLDLLLLDRAGTQELRDFQLTKIKRAQRKAKEHAKRYQEEKISSAEETAIYYSSWMVSAIHMLLTIPQYRTVNLIAKRLSISKEQANQTLQQLKKLNLAEMKGKGEGAEWNTTKNRIHLPERPPFTVMNHRNWREVALEHAARSKVNSTHYTAVYSLSKKDYDQLQSMLRNFLDETRKKVFASPEEEIAVFLCDFFVLDRGGTH